MLSLLVRALLASSWAPGGSLQGGNNLEQAVFSMNRSPHQSGAEKPVGRSFTKTEQDSDLCAAGSRQWTGKIEVTHGNDLFYWYFESQQFPERAPLLIWLTGGPGEACTVPLLNGGGPCTINEHGNGTKYSRYSWTTEFNVLYVDEIAGVGFSKSQAKATTPPQTIDDVTLDLKYFLNTFISEAFPALRGRDIHITGESYGGLQAISLAYALANPETPGPQPDLQIKSLVASSTFADVSYSMLSWYDVLCGRSETHLNTTECATMAAAVPGCEKVASRCRLTGAYDDCTEMAEWCGPLTQYWYPPLKNIVHLHKPCKSFPTCDERMGAIEKYLNSVEIQTKLGFPEGERTPYVGMDMDVNFIMASNGSIWLPNSEKYEYLLEKTDVRILGRGGWNDPDTPIEGSLRALEALRWWGQGPFRSSQPEPWYYTDSTGAMVRGGLRKGFDKMWFVTFDESGHLIDKDAPMASIHILKQWIKGGLPTVA